MAKTLKQIRLAHDLTQEQMAERLDFSRVAYCNIEKGKSSGSIRFWRTLKEKFPDAVDDIHELISKKA